MFIIVGLILGNVVFEEILIEYLDWFWVMIVESGNLVYLLVDLVVCWVVF